MAMRSWHKWIWLAAVATVGCQSSRKVPYSDNPLLLAREPLTQPSAVASKTPAAVSVTQSYPAPSAPKAIKTSIPVTTTSGEGPALPPNAT